MDELDTLTAVSIAWKENGAWTAFESLTACRSNPCNPGTGKVFNAKDGAREAKVLITTGKGGEDDAICTITVCSEALMFK